MKLEIAQKTIGAFCASCDDIRIEMQGVRVDKENGCLIATDGIVLVNVPINCDGINKSITLPLTVFPKKKGNYTEISIEGENVYVEEWKGKGTGNAFVCVEKRLCNIDHSLQNYPDWKSVLPQKEWKPELLAPIYLNMLFVAKFGELAKELDGSTACACTFYGPRKCVQINGKTFSGLLMPINLW